MCEDLDIYTVSEDLDGQPFYWFLVLNFEKYTMHYSMSMVCPIHVFIEMDLECSIFFLTESC